MKGKTSIVLALIVSAFSLSQAANPGPYPVIFIHGQQQTATCASGWLTWDDEESVMRQLVPLSGLGYNNYTYGTPKNCDVSSVLTSTGGDPLKVYSFSYYNPDASQGVIGDNYYSSATLDPKASNYQADYNTSAANAEWAQNLATFINKVLTATGASRVNLVCHSMGGLVVRDAITFYGCDEKVFKVMMIGTPNHGFTEPKWVEAIYALFADYPTWQKHGELLEMALNSDWILETVKFTSTSSSGSKLWVDWLYDADKGTIWPSNYWWSDPPFYGTIAGTRPRIYTVLFASNDGVVARKSVELDYSQFNRTYFKFHYKGSNDQPWEALPTCQQVKEEVKKWIFNYNVPPEITRVDWTKSASAMAAMSLLSKKPRWDAQVYFKYKETSGWTFDKYKFWRRRTDKEWGRPLDGGGSFKQQRKIDPKNFQGIKKAYPSETWYWKVEVLHHYDTDPQYSLSSEPFHSTSPAASPSPPPPSCPILYSFIGRDDTTSEYCYLQNNTLLPRSQFTSDTAIDNIVLSYPPPPENGNYYLYVAEENTAVSYFTDARLYAVDHPIGTQVATSALGGVYVYSNVLEPNQFYKDTIVWLPDSLDTLRQYVYPIDLLDQIGDIDTSIITANSLDTFYVSFPPVEWSNTGLLMSTGISPSQQISPVKNYYFSVCVPSGDTGWSPIPGGQALARHSTSDWIIDVSSPLMSSDTESMTFKIICNANSIGYLDRVALVKIEPSGWSMTESQINNAIYWEQRQGVPVGTNISDLILHGSSPLLRANEQFALSYAAVPQDTMDTTMTRDFVFKTRGRYTYQVLSPGTEDRGELPKEYKFSIKDLLISPAQNVGISYQLPQSGKTTITVMDVTGRRMAVLVNGKQEAGYYTVNWDGKDQYGEKLRSGVYFVRISSGKYSNSTKLVMLR